MIVLTNVSKTYDQGQTHVIKPFSLRIQKGETVVLLGSSGSGKTTTLKMINRLVEPSTGSIEVDGKNILSLPVTELRRSIGYAFQGVGLFPHMTVAENIAIVLRLQGVAKTKRLARAKELLEFVNLSPDTYSERLPQELSGGQQQRVGVARALANDPDYLLMDEPFGALDAINRDALQEEVLHLKQALNKTIVFVTHDVFEALRLGDRFVVMHKGEIIQVGNKQEILHQPASQFVQDLFAKPAQQVTAYLEQMR